jgi:hypothetical protein
VKGKYYEEGRIRKERKGKERGKKGQEQMIKGFIVLLAKSWESAMVVFHFYLWTLEDATLN